MSSDERIDLSSPKLSESDALYLRQFWNMVAPYLDIALLTKQEHDKLTSARPTGYIKVADPRTARIEKYFIFSHQRRPVHLIDSAMLFLLAKEKVISLLAKRWARDEPDHSGDCGTAQSLNIIRGLITRVGVENILLEAHLLLPVPTIHQHFVSELYPGIFIVIAPAIEDFNKLSEGSGSYRTIGHFKSQRRRFNIYKICLPEFQDDRLIDIAIVVDLPDIIYRSFSASKLKFLIDKK